MESDIFQLSNGIKNIHWASFTNNIHTGLNLFAAATFEDLWVHNFQAD